MRRWEVQTSMGVVNLEAKTWRVNDTGVLHFLGEDLQPVGPLFSMAQVVQWRALSP